MNTKSCIALLAAAVACGMEFVAAESCSAAFASCGTDTTTPSCCPDNFYCQPWSANFYQCVMTFDQCSTQLVNTEFHGDTLKTLSGLQPKDCCSACAQTTGCVAYTFVNSNPGTTACYLKSAMSDRRAKVGAVSGLVNAATSTPTTKAPTTAPATTATPTTTPTPTTTATPTTTPTPTTTTPEPSTTVPATTTPAPSLQGSVCPTPNYGKCGNSNGTTCCPEGFYCQPWDPTSYECVMVPTQCDVPVTDKEYVGSTLKTVFVSQPELCCNECANTAGCKAYTYINNNPGKPVCYLKSAAGTPMRRVGAIAGKLL